MSKTSQARRWNRRTTLKNVWHQSEIYVQLTLNARIATKVVCFSRLLKTSMANSVDPDQTAPIGSVGSVPMLFASMLKLSVMLDNYLQQTTSADDIFRCIFFLGALKTYAAISNAHLSRVCKRGKLSGSCLSTLNGFGSTQLPIFLCHIGVPTFSSQKN